MTGIASEDSIADRVCNLRREPDARDAALSYFQWKEGTA